MLKKRIIPCLDIKDGRTVKGINFVNIRDAGDPVELAKRYMKEGADELVFLDITATIDHRNILVDLVGKIAEVTNIPFTVGGGINSLLDAQNLIKAGADKISINSAAVRDPQLIKMIAREFGSQCVVVAIDTKFEKNEWMVYVKGGRMATGIRTIEWAEEIEQLGAGEVLLTSMNNDGTKNGYAIQITNLISKTLHIPVIASGGAGSMEHFKEVFQQTQASAALAASLFHFGELNIQDLKKYLKLENIPVNENKF